jgi:hypothetical protein
MQTKTANERARHGVVRWRRRQLVDSGFPLPLAARLAKDQRYDLHALIELAERGCDSELAVRILAPIEGETAA